MFESLRERVAVISCAIMVFLFYGMLAAAVARFLTSLSEVASLLFIGVPVGALVAFLLWPKLPRILGFRQNDAA
jgi:hypothetical protein